ncbi:MAG: hypothetical protein LBH19_01035 [Dysgonamonadaceae bacterium]|nr:hypothetical protein [Dysgonamonadaceae bacterium]
MKKLGLLALLVVFFTACTKEYITEENVNVYSYSRYFQVTRNQWKKATDQNNYFLYYYCTFSEPRLTNEILDNGSMNAYLYYKIDGLDTFSPLPYSDFIVDADYKWEEQLTVEFQPGYITFILKIDDFYAVSPLEYYNFVVRFLW